jgi:hypothetical protein
MSRPLSSTSNSVYGQKKADLSINPKVTIYRSNGFGRDAYISSSNGGFRKGCENYNYTTPSNK